MVIKVINLDKCIRKFKDISDMDLSPQLEDATEIVREEAYNLAPKDTGIMAGTIEKSPYNGVNYKNGGEVRVGTEYAIYQEFGWSGHTIKPKRMKFLRWIKDGQEYFAKSVYIPPKKGIYFMTRALTMWESYIKRMIEKSIKQYIILKSS